MKRCPLLSATCLVALLLASAAVAGTQPKLDGGPLAVGILLLNKPFITEFAGASGEDQGLYRV